MLDRVTEIIKREDGFELSRTIDAILTNIEAEEMGSAVGQCKNLLEGLSKKVLDKKAIAYDSGVKLNKLVKEAVKALDIGGVGNDDQKTKEAFLKIAGSIGNVIDNTAESLATLRNEYSKDGHARGVGFVDIPKEYANLIIHQTDIIVAFLLNICKRHDEFKPPIQFTDHEDYNTYLYDTFGELEIFGDLYQTPEILFALHPQKYRDELKVYQKNKGATDDE